MAEKAAAFLKGVKIREGKGEGLQVVSINIVVFLGFYSFFVIAATKNCLILWLLF